MPCALSRIYHSPSMVWLMHSFYYDSSSSLSVRFYVSIKIMKMARQLSSKYCHPRRRYHTYLLVLWFIVVVVVIVIIHIYWYCDSSLPSSSSLSYIFTGIMIHRRRRHDHRYHKVFTSIVIHHFRRRHDHRYHTYLRVLWFIVVVVMIIVIICIY